MEFRFEAEDLRPLGAGCHRDNCSTRSRTHKLDSQLAFTEPEAAALLGVKPYVLRDCRRRGELDGSKVGSKIVYTRVDLLAFLERQKQ